MNELIASVPGFRQLTVTQFAGVGPWFADVYWVDEETENMYAQQFCGETMEEAVAGAVSLALELEDDEEDD